MQYTNSNTVQPSDCAHRFRNRMELKPNQHYIYAHRFRNRMELETNQHDNLVLLNFPRGVYLALHRVHSQQGDRQVGGGPLGKSGPCKNVTSAWCAWVFVEREGISVFCGIWWFIFEYSGAFDGVLMDEGSKSPFHLSVIPNTSSCPSLKIFGGK